MTISVITPAVTEPITPSAVLALLGLPSTSLPYATTLAQAARQGVETAIAGVLLTQTLLWQTVVPSFLANDTLQLPIQPVIAVQSVTIGGVVLPAAQYQLEPSGILRLSVPEQTPISVQFTAGYGSSGTNLPAALLLAVQQLIVQLHQDGGHMPDTWHQALQPYKTLRLV